jgi:hypothetical protein
MVARTVCSAVALYLGRSLRRPFCMRAILFLLLPMSNTPSLRRNLFSPKYQSRLDD